VEALTWESLELADLFQTDATSYLYLSVESSFAADLPLSYVFNSYAPLSHHLTESLFRSLEDRHILHASFAASALFNAHVRTE
jgi:hypothetical protein